MGVKPARQQPAPAASSAPVTRSVDRPRWGRSYADNTTTTLQWLVSAYAVAFGGFLLLGGRLADAYGRARLYRIGLVVFTVAQGANYPLRLADFSGLRQLPVSNLPRNATIPACRCITLS